MKIQKNLIRKIILNALLKEGFISREELISDINAAKKNRKLRRKMIKKYHPDFEEEAKIFLDDRKEQFQIFMDAFSNPGYNLSSIRNFIDHSQNVKSSKQSGFNDFEKLLKAKDLFDFYQILEEINLTTPSMYIRNILDKMSKNLIRLYNKDESVIVDLMTLIPNNFMVNKPGDVKSKFQMLVANYLNMV